MVAFQDKTNKVVGSSPMSHVENPKLITDFAFEKLLVEVRFQKIYVIFTEEIKQINTYNET